MPEMTLTQQAASILGTIRATLKNGKILADEETVAKRLFICETCPKLKLKERKGTLWYACKVCGCSYKRKIAVSGSSCPLGKW